MRKGDHPDNIAPLLTLSLTPVPTRNRRVYVTQSKGETTSRQQYETK